MSDTSILVGWGLTALLGLFLAVLWWSTASDLDAHRADYEDHLRDSHDPLVGRVHDLEKLLAAVHARIDSLHIPEPREPATLPLTIVRGVPTDTAPGIAAVGAAVRQVFDDDAHTRGRHAHREGADA